MNEEERLERKERILNKQMELADGGSVEMLKWLGIQYCGQSSQPNTESESLPNGFQVRRIPTKYEKEYEENREEFLKWKESTTL